MSSNIVKNLLNVSTVEQRKFLDSFDYVLTDCDGTIWQLREPIDGAGAGVERLKKNGKKVLYITNNSARSVEEYDQKFIESKINGSFSDILHPAVNTVDYLKMNNFKGLIYLIASNYFKKILTDAGYDIIEESNESCETFRGAYERTYDKKPVKAVIMDTDFNLNVLKMIRASFYLQDPDCIFLVGATERNLPIKPVTVLGPGVFSQILEEATNRKATVIGKPSLCLRDIVLRKCNVTNPKRVLFVGDLLEKDIGFGKMCGFQTLLVLTGGTTEAELLAHDKSEQIPDYYLNGFADFVEIYNNLFN